MVTLLSNRTERAAAAALSPTYAPRIASASCCRRMCLEECMSFRRQCSGTVHRTELHHPTPRRIRVHVRSNLSGAVSATGTQTRKTSTKRIQRSCAGTQPAGCSFSRGGSAYMASGTVSRSIMLPAPTRPILIAPAIDVDVQASAS